MRRPAYIASTVAAALVLASGAARANPVDMFGFGARGSAMARAHTAATNDGSANYYNPGALAFSDDFRIEIGYQLAHPELSMNGGDQHVDDSRGITVGFVIPGRILGQRIAIGAGLFVPDQTVLTGRSKPAQQPRWALYDDRPKRIFFAAHGSVTITDTLAVGVGIGTVSDTDGTYALTGRLGFPVAEDSDLLLDIEVDTEPATYVQAGVLWQARPWLRLGATFRDEFGLRSIQIIQFEADIGPAGQPPAVEDAFLDLTSVGIGLFQPRQLALGFAARLTDRVLLAGDLVWHQWSRFVNPTPDIQVELDVGDLNDLVELDEFPPLEDPRFHDVATVHLGAEVTVARRPKAAVDLRGGYAYEPSPAPEQIGESNFLDNDRHAVTGGLGVTVSDVTRVLPRPFRVDAFFAATVLPPRHHHKLSAADLVGDIESRGHVLSAGISSSFAF